MFHLTLVFNLEAIIFFHALFIIDLLSITNLVVASLFYVDCVVALCSISIVILLYPLLCCVKMCFIICNLENCIL